MAHYPKLWKSGISVFCSNPHCLAQSHAQTDDFRIELDSSKHPQAHSVDCCWGWMLPSTRTLSLVGLQISLLASGLACDCPNTCTESANSILRYEFLWSWALWHSSISTTPGSTFWSGSAPWPLVHWPLGELHWNDDFAIIPLWVCTDIQQYFSAL